MMTSSGRLIRTGLAAGLLGAALAGCVSVNREALKGGGSTPRLWLRNDKLAVAFLPELGGKIVSLQDATGREYLSRSARPYSKRVYGKPYGETEFDGLDELFPTLGACDFPAGPWAGRKVPGHGELIQMPWRVENGPGVTLAVASPGFPYEFRRQATLEGDTLVLSYTVTNSSDSAFPFLYALHPLFVGGAGCRMDIPDDLPMTMSWSKGAFLGKRGEVKPWGSITNAAGGLFKEAVFVPDSGRYYKFFSPRLKVGQFRLIYADGTALEMTWPADRLPRYAIWCSEGGVDGLHHIGIEPTTTALESLAEAVAANEAPTIPPHGTVTWQIRIRIVSAR